MFFLFSITHANSDSNKPPGSKKAVHFAYRSVVTYILIILWVLLIIFGIISVINPPWLVRISRPGKDVEARAKKDYGDLFLRKGDYDNAVSQYLAALEIKPDMVDVTTNLGITYAKMGREEKAVEILNHALTQDPEMPSVIYYNLAEIYETTGNLNEAIMYFNIAAENAAFPIYSYRKLGKLHLDRREWTLAIYALQLAISHKLDLENSYEGMLKRDYHLYSDREEVRDTIKALLAEGVDRNQLENYDSEIFDRILEEDPNLSRIHNFLGYAYAQTGNTITAIQHYQAALKIWPQNLEAENNLKIASEIK